MPEAFTNCQKNGGKIITKKLKGNKYMHICYDKQGNAHPGEVKEKKSTSQLIEMARTVADRLRNFSDILRN